MLKRNPAETIECAKECEQLLLHGETRKVLRPSAIHICMLQCSQPDIFHILNVGAQTLRLNLLLIHEV